MPISNDRGLVDRKKVSFTPKKTGINETRASETDLLSIGSTPSHIKKPYRRSYITLDTNVKKHDNIPPIETLALHIKSNGIHISRVQKEKEKYPDRINLDRRGLNIFPKLENESKLRLLSLQHNLINNLEGLKNQTFPYLVFLDMYDNQLEKITCLDNLINLRVLLLGKNRLRVIEGFENLTKMEVLDLHGNQLQMVSGLSTLKELKVLNLSGNQLKIIGCEDFQGLSSLQELNMRRNRLRKLVGFNETLNLQKLFLSNNELQTIEDMSIIAKLPNLIELSIDNNPVFLSGDCMPFLVSCLPNLSSLNSIQVTSIVRNAATTWRRNKESTNSTLTDVSSNTLMSDKGEAAMCNAKSKWGLIRSQTKCLTVTLNSTIAKVRKLEPDVDFILTGLLKPERTKYSNHKSINTARVPTLINKQKSKCTVSKKNDNFSCNSSSTETFQLPPVLVPIIAEMEQKQYTTAFKEANLSDSLSSIDPNIDSSISSLHTTLNEISGTEAESNDEETNEEQLEVISDDKSPGVLDVQDKQKSVEGITSNSSENSNDIRNSLSTNIASNIRVSSATNESNNSAPKSSRNVQPNYKTLQIADIKECPILSSGSHEKEQGGDYLIEISGRHLNIYGHGALKFVDKCWGESKANDVTTVNINYANFNGFVTILSKIKFRFPKAVHFTFKEANIQYLGQLNALAEIQGMLSLYIHKEGNPITLKKWKSYAIYRLSHWGLQTINGEEVTANDIIAANEEYQSLSDLVLWSLPEVLLQPLLTRLHIDLYQTGTEQSAKEWLLKADPALKSVVTKESLQWKKGASTQEDLISHQTARRVCELLVDKTCSAIRKLRLLEKEWPSILQNIVQNTLVDYSQLDIYMKEKLNELL